MFDVFLSKISAIQSQDPLKCTGYPKVHTFFRIYGVHFEEEVQYSNESRFSELIAPEAA